ncbi:shikimate O-hydroxycinnamoyltransferase-like [Ipomoea triloba]|uniref:shikimate O-hydroxycinnamoyltransferase-like n=1 Tax=Ipomoea triloba TaxID=35885 RepID=UPI00125E92A7|nr:shikimate O-hydroxycinnamoyltransferase-like [Ipomoea triloba]
MEEGKGSRVRVESMLTVVSSTPIEPNKVQKLNALDHALGLHTLHIIFYYRANPFREGPMELDLDNLRVTLSEHLCKYPPATGRLGPDEEGNWEVKCNDAGIRMLRARVGVTVDEWLRSADALEERDLTVWEDMPQDPTIWSPFRIQLNDFEGGGLAIGLSFTHMHADPTSATLFFKSWADFHRGLPILHPPIFSLPAFTNHPIPNPTSKTSEYYNTKCKEAETVSAPKMSTLTFRFSGSKIMKCLSQVHPICPDATPFDVLAALFWLRIMRFTSPTPLSICLDFRSHKSKVIPFHYFGNALHFSSLSLHAEALEDCELGHVAGLVHEHVTRIDEGEFWSAVDWFESPKGETGKYAPPFTMYGPELTCISMEHMSCADGTTDESLMYSAMFRQDERPVHVSYHVGNAAGKGLIMVMPSPGDRLGRTVMVSLPEQRIAILSQDQAIVELDPIMLISGKR